MNDPLIQAVAAPYAVALVLTAFLAHVAGRRAATIAGVALGAGFIAAYVLIARGAPAPLPAAEEKLVFVVLFAALLGGGLDGLHANRPAQRALLLAGPAAAVIWFAWRPLMAGQSAIWSTLALLALAGSVWLWALHRIGARGGAVAGSTLVVTALALAGVANFGGSSGVALFAIAVAAAAGGFTSWRYFCVLRVGGVSDAGSSVVMAGGMAIFALAAILVLYKPTANTSATGLLILVAAGAFLALRRVGALADPRLAPPIHALASLCLAAPALIVAFLAAAP